MIFTREIKIKKEKDTIKGFNKFIQGIQKFFSSQLVILLFQKLCITFIF